MNILIEIGHPAHVHFFRNVIENLKKHGHRIFIVTRNKEITDHLLDRFGYNYTHLTKPAKTKIGLIVELLFRWYKIIRIIKKEKINVTASISGISTSFPAWICGIGSVTFTDTEDASFTNRIAFPFSTAIVTPSFYLNDLGKKHIRYFGLQELSYLKNFKLTDRENSDLFPEKFCVIRLIGYDAVHDWKIDKLSNENLDILIGILERFGKVVIISQRELDSKYRKYVYSFPKEMLHSLMKGCKMFVGESPTMAVEFALLGIPAFLLSERFPRLGYVSKLGTDYGLLENFDNFRELANRIQGIKNIENLKDKWEDNSQKFKSEVDDVGEVAATIIENIRYR